ncbi:MAG: hypothetical protein Q9207_003916 [Kuettlingeria erythrocarpa]
MALDFLSFQRPAPYLEDHHPKSTPRDPPFQQDPYNASTNAQHRPYQLFYLAFLRIYVTKSDKTTTSHFNRIFQPQQRLTAKDCAATYLNLHDSEHASWARARKMNVEEPHMLKAMMQFLGLARKRWNMEFIQPVGPMGCYRLAG